MPETNGALSAGKLGSRIGVNIYKLWFVFRRPCSTPARPSAQAADRLWMYDSDIVRCD